MLQHLFHSHIVLLKLCYEMNGQLQMPKILNIGESRQAMAEFFCDIEILRNEGEFEARVEGLTPNVMSLKSDNLEELLEQLTIELEDKLNQSVAK